MSKVVMRLTLREYLAAFVLASIADILLLVVWSQLASRAGRQVDLVRVVGLHEALVAVLTVCVAAAGSVARGWRWAYVACGTLFAGYVAYRMMTRFVSAFELVGPLQDRGVEVSQYLGFFYTLALGSAISYVGMILVLRRAYGQLVSARTREHAELDRQALFS